MLICSLNFHSLEKDSVSRLHLLNFIMFILSLLNLFVEICWTPYKSWVLPAALAVDKRLITRLGPIFCSNFISIHKPNFVPKQFGREAFHLEGRQLAAINHHFRMIDNRGCNGHNYSISYNHHVELWKQKICLLDEGDDESDHEFNGENIRGNDGHGRGRGRGRPRGRGHGRRVNGDGEVRRSTRLNPSYN